MSLPPYAQGSIPGGAARSPFRGGNFARWKHQAFPDAPHCGSDSLTAAVIAISIASRETRFRWEDGPFFPVQGRIWFSSDQPPSTNELKPAPFHERRFIKVFGTSSRPKRKSPAGVNRRAVSSAIGQKNSRHRDFFV